VNDDFVFCIDEREARQLRGISEAYSKEFRSSEDPELVREAAVIAHQIPQRIRSHVNKFRLNDCSPYAIIRGHEIDQQRIGQTPRDWRDKEFPGSSFPEELLLLLYSSLLGDPFGWITQQDGRMVHDIFPIERDAGAQLGSGSRELLTWHTEDAFHPFRADYLLLLAIRNPDSVPTTIGALDVSKISERYVDVLFDRRFYILPDESHLPKNNTHINKDAFNEIMKMMEDAAETVSILDGVRDCPYIRIDPYFMHTRPGDADAKHALDHISDTIDADLQDVVLRDGDLIIIDNRRAVHGRRAFKARFDGTDRWLKRVNVTRDLRKSILSRKKATERLI